MFRPIQKGPQRVRKNVPYPITNEGMKNIQKRITGFRSSDLIWGRFQCTRKKGSLFSDLRDSCPYSVPHYAIHRYQHRAIVESTTTAVVAYVVWQCRAEIVMRGNVSERRFPPSRVNRYGWVNERTKYIIHPQTELRGMNSQRIQPLPNHGKNDRCVGNIKKGFS